ncbi:hypothetical protein BXU09_17610 [Deinococcus sp. LM3]|nr:hypothetical protein BXU09_17610 [Deinococcus sp. LM3]
MNALLAHVPAQLVPAVCWQLAQQGREELTVPEVAHLLSLTSEVMQPYAVADRIRCADLLATLHSQHVDEGSGSDGLGPCSGC